MYVKVFISIYVYPCVFHYSCIHVLKSRWIKKHKYINYIRIYILYIWNEEKKIKMI